MRKFDREIKDLNEITELIDGCDTLRVGFNDEGCPYIVPLSFGYEVIDGAFVFYVHGAKAGRRHELAAKSELVCVEADVCKGFVTLPSGDQTADYRSFIGKGTIETITGDEAVHALTALCRHCGFDTMHCTQAVVNATCVEKITGKDFTSKQRFK